MAFWRGTSGRVDSHTRRCAGGSRRGRSAGVVDDVGNLTEVIESDRDHVLEANGGQGGGFDGARKANVRLTEY